MHGFQSGQQFHHLRSNQPASLHAVEPAPASIPFLQGLQFFYGLPHTVIHRIQVEQQSNPLSLLLFICRLSQPRCFGQQHAFQFLIFLQFTPQRFFLYSLLFPGFKHRLNLRIQFHNFPCHRIGVVSRSPGERIVLLRISYYRKCLYGIPYRSRSQFDGQLPVLGRLALSVKQILQVHFLRLPAFHLQGQGFRHPLLVSQHRKIMLFSVTELASFRLHPANQDLAIHIYRESKTHTTRFSCLHLKILHCLIHHTFIHRIHQFQTYRPFHLFR